MVFVVLLVSLDAFVDASIFPSLWNIVWGDAGISFLENTDDETFGSENRMELAWMFFAEIIISYCPFAWVGPFGRNFHAYAITTFAGFVIAGIAFGTVRIIYPLSPAVAIGFPLLAWVAVSFRVVVFFWFHFLFHLRVGGGGGGVECPDGGPSLGGGGSSPEGE